MSLLKKYIYSFIFNAIFNSLIHLIFLHKWPPSCLQTILCPQSPSITYILRINSCQRNWDLLEWTRELAFNQCISGVIQCLWMNAVKQIKIIRGLNGADGQTPTRPVRLLHRRRPVAFSVGTTGRRHGSRSRRMLCITIITDTACHLVLLSISLARCIQEMIMH